MQKLLLASAALVTFFQFSGAAFADSYQSHIESCLTKFANTADAATVTLECMAAEGKLSGCKVVDNSAPAKGFDKAAMCVADYLPMGAKAGTLQVPFRFPGGGDQ